MFSLGVSALFKQAQPMIKVEKWHFVSDGKAIGPVDHKDLIQKIRSREIDATTLVW